MNPNPAELAKMVELYEQFKDAEWWPKMMLCSKARWWTPGYSGSLHPSHAYSAIGFAMVQKLTRAGTNYSWHFAEQPHNIKGDAARFNVWFAGARGNEAPTLFLSLALAIEALEKP